MTDLKIYVATHKSISAPDDPCYVPIQAGAKSSPGLGILGDDSGDNISDKNKYYSEMTAHYWIWKNSSSDFVGLVHYRRYLAPSKIGIVHLGKSIASGADLRRDLSESGIVLPEPLIFTDMQSNTPQTVEQQYFSCHGSDILYARQICERLHPRYMPAYDFVMQNNRMIGFNIIVARRDIFDSYSEWVFSMLFELEQVIPLSSKQGYQARVMGFLAERLLTVWIAHNRDLLRIEYRPHVFYDDV